MPRVEAQLMTHTLWLNEAHRANVRSRTMLTVRGRWNPAVFLRHPLFSVGEAVGVFFTTLLFLDRVCCFWHVLTAHFIYNSISIEMKIPREWMFQILEIAGLNLMHEGKMSSFAQNKSLMVNFRLININCVITCPCLGEGFRMFRQCGQPRAPGQGEV